MTNSKKKATTTKAILEVLTKAFKSRPILVIGAVIILVIIMFAMKVVTVDDVKEMFNPSTDTTEIGMMSTQPSATPVSQDVPSGKFTLPIAFLKDSSVLRLSGAEFVLRNEFGTVHFGQGQFNPENGELIMYISPEMPLEALKDSLMRRQENAITSTSEEISSALEAFVD